MTHDLDQMVIIFIFNIQNRKACCKQKLFRINPKTKIKKKFSDMTQSFKFFKLPNSSMSSLITCDQNS